MFRIYNEPALAGETRRGLFYSRGYQKIQSNCMNKADANRELFPLERAMDLLLFSFYTKRI